MGQRKVAGFITTRIKLMALWAMLMSVTAPAFADPGEYQVELVIFSQNLPNTEVFDQVGSQISWPANLYESYDYKKPEALALTTIYSTVANNATYQPLLHVGWIQKIDMEGDPAAVHIRSPDGRINGYVLMQKTQVLQLTADLEYAPGGSDNATGSVVYRLNQSRQVKPDELHYLDHPKFGVIAKVSAK